MPGVPAFLLRRLYMKGSLENHESGWRFALKNSLGSGYARAMHPLTCDGAEVPMNHTTFSLDGRETLFSQVNDGNTFTLALNKEILISVRGERLSQGIHKIGMSFVVPGFGKIGFDFADEVKTS